MATLEEAQLAILTEIKAKATGANAEALANLATAFQSAGGVIPNTPPEPAFQASAAVLDAITTLAGAAPSSEQLSELAYAYQVLQEPLTVSELLSSANASIVQITTLTREAVSAIENASEGVVLDTEAATQAATAAQASAASPAGSVAAVSSGVTAATDAATRAGTSATAAAASERNALASERAAKTSETNAAASAETADTRAGSATGAAAAALSSERAAKTSETNAGTSATAAAASERNAKTSETNADSARRAAEAARDEAEAISGGNGLVTNLTDTSVGDAEIAVFSSTSGKAIKTGGTTLDAFRTSLTTSITSAVNAEPIAATRITSGTIDLARLPSSLVVTTDARLSDARTPIAHTHPASQITGLDAAISSKLDASAYTASDVLAKLLTVDGVGSGLDADRFGGQLPSYYRSWTNLQNVPAAFVPVAHTHRPTEIVDANGNPAPLYNESDIEAIAQRIVNAQLAGTIVQLPSTGVPSGRRILKLNGAEISRTSYAALWTFAQSSGNLASSQGAKTAAQFGPGNGSTTFTLPDYRGYFLRALADGASRDTNRAIATVQSSQNLSHNHSADTGAAGSHSHGGSTSTNGYHGHISGTDVQGSHSHTLDRSALSTPGGDIGGVSAGGYYNGISASSSMSQSGNHNHAVNVQPTGDHSHSISTDTASSHYHAVSVYSAGGDESRPINLAVLYGIFY